MPCPVDFTEHTAMPSFFTTRSTCLAAGELKSTKLSRFLNQFYNGKACAAAVKIGASIASTHRCACTPARLL
jgi:hypothetical protein